MTNHLDSLRAIAENPKATECEDSPMAPLEILKTTWTAPSHIVIVSTRGVFETHDAGFNWKAVLPRCPSRINGGMHPK